MYEGSILHNRYNGSYNETGQWFTNTMCNGIDLYCLHLDAIPQKAKIRNANHSIYMQGAPSSAALSYFNAIMDKVTGNYKDYVIFRSGQYDYWLYYSDKMISSGQYITADYAEYVYYGTNVQYNQYPVIEKGNETNFRLDTGFNYSVVYSNLDDYNVYNTNARMSGQQTTSFILVVCALVAFVVSLGGYGLRSRFNPGGGNGRRAIK